MEEDERRREVGVVVDYVGEVGHGFSAFVHWGCEGGVRGVGGGVDGVDRRLPVWQVLCYPVRVLLLRLGHDDDLAAGLAAEGWDVLHGAMLKGVLPRVRDVGRNAVLVPNVLELDFNDEK